MTRDPRLDARWATVDRVFEGALDLDPSEVEGYLISATDDPDIRDEVRRLLTVDREAARGFLESPLRTRALEDWKDALGTSIGHGSPELDRSGEQVGPFRLVRRLGRGGMASVYLAERTDGSWVQHVAVKVIRRGLDTEDVVQRFRSERQILSALVHPNIARLLDGGSTSDGQPYLAMEYVDGRPVTDHCDAQKLSLADRLRLFLQVTDAVAYAHRMLVVHRDIKPSNILVATDGRPRLLDFGIAKILEPTQWPGEDPVTRTGLRLLTPEYASPEQLSGAPVTTATDVYQLGLLLFRLLVGRPPFGDERTTGEGVRHGGTTTVPRPTTVLRRLEGRTLEALAAARATTPGLWARALAGDLEQIVLKAVEEDPARRYRSVEALSDDLDRYLSGHPVRARAAGPVYRLRKFLGRNRWVAPAAVIGTTAAAGYVVVVGRHADALERERNIAQAEAATATAVTDFVVGLFRGTDPYQGGSADVPARALLDQGAQRILDGEWGRPKVRGALVEAVTRAYSDLHLHAEVVDFAKAAVGLAPGATWNEPLDPARAGIPERPLRAIETAVGYALIQIGSHLEGRTLVERLLARQRALGDSTSAGYVRNMATVSQAHFLEGNGEEGERVTRAWIPLAGALDRDPSMLTLMALDRLYHLSMSALDHEATEALALRQLEQAHALYPDTTPAVAHAYEDLASARVRAGKWEDAAAPAETATAIAAAMFGRDNATTSYAAETLASIYLELGRVDEALELQREVTEVRIRALGEDHMIIPMTRYQLARALRRAEMLGEAEGEVQWALERTIAAFGPTSRLTAVMTEELGRIHLADGALDSAERHLAQAGRLYADAYRPTDLRRVHWTLAMAELRLAQGRGEEANALLDAQALALAEDGMAAHPLALEVEEARSAILRN